MPTLVSDLYPELIHYTGSDGLRGVLSSGCLWATDASCLNDSSEITHFFDERLRALIRKEADDYAMELARDPKYLAQMVRDGGIEKVVNLEVEALHATLRRATLAFNRPFVFSLSGPRDSRVQRSGLLSQWRGYGGDGGYALVFDTKDLEALLAAESQAHHYMFVQMGDVFYHGIDPKDQPAATSDVSEYEEVVRQGISSMMRKNSADEVETFYDSITALSCLYKHWGFWEEREVRVVVVPSNDEVVRAGQPNVLPPKDVKLRQRDGKDVPYVELFAAAASAHVRFRLPIKRVIVGPHRDREVRADSVRAMLASYGYTADVEQSEIPYIG